MTPIQTENVGEKVSIRRGRVDSLTIFEITDYELDILAAGSPSSIYLNFSVALFSLAIAGIFSILTATFKTNTAYFIALLITILGFIIGFLLLILWHRSNQSISKIVTRIKARVLEPAENQTSPNEESGQSN
jgi:hypothetical protein